MTLTTGYSDSVYGDFVNLENIVTNYSALVPTHAANNNLWVIGDAQNFLGNSDISYYPRRAGISATYKWSQISPNLGMAGIKSDGTLWVTGSNSSGAANAGRLGLGDAIDRSSLTQVGALTNWSKVSMGPMNCAAIKTDGTLWVWGPNTQGQLGQGDTVDRNTPTQVGGLTTWKEIGCGYNFWIAIKTDGTLWGCGTSYYQIFGLGIKYSTPTQIGVDNTWSKLSVSHDGFGAIKSNGTMWTCGKNGKINPLYPLYGLSTADSPVQVGTLTTWSQISTGLEHFLAIKTDGTLWGWGAYDMYGETGAPPGNGGSGTGYYYGTNTPAQIGGLTTWTQICAGYFISFGIQSDGTLWGWGLNTGGTGNLGIGSTAIDRYSSPVRIGTMTNWSKLPINSTGIQGTAALTA